MISDGTENEAHTLREKLAAVELERDAAMEYQRQLIGAITKVVWSFDKTELLTVGQYGTDLLRVWERIQQRAQDVRRLVEAARAKELFYHSRSGDESRRRLATALKPFEDLNNE